VEGVPVHLRRTRHGQFKTTVASKVLIADSVSELAKQYVEDSGLLRRRDVLKRTHLAKLRQGRKKWNAWRRDNPDIRPVLSNENIAATFQNLDRFDFSYTNMCQSNLSGVSLQGASFHQAILAGADFSHAHLDGANFCRTDLYETVFTNASFEGANLQGVQLARTNMRKARLRGCKVYGMSAWDLDTDGAKQKGLIVRYRPDPDEEREEDVTVDSLDLAAFMYLTRKRANIRRVIEATSQKWVLLLGRFGEGTHVLKALERALLRKHFMPIIFDFPRPEQRDLIETLLLLAGLSGFVIVEISNPRSTPLEMLAIASNYAVPILPIITGPDDEFGMFSGLRKFPWVRPALSYKSLDQLKKQVLDQVIKQARVQAERLTESKRVAAAVRRRGSVPRSS
jgi:uncharacterized protein YjbI with pentapeptide repeats